MCHEKETGLAGHSAGKNGQEEEDVGKHLDRLGGHLEPVGGRLIEALLLPGHGPEHVPRHGTGQGNTGRNREGEILEL